MYASTSVTYRPRLGTTPWKRMLPHWPPSNQVDVEHVMRALGMNRHIASTKLSIWYRLGRVKRVRKGVYERVAF